LQELQQNDMMQKSFDNKAAAGIFHEEDDW